MKLLAAQSSSFTILMSIQVLVTGEMIRLMMSGELSPIIGAYRAIMVQPPVSETLMQSRNVLKATSGTPNNSNFCNGGLITRRIKYKDRTHPNLPTSTIIATLIIDNPIDEDMMEAYVDRKIRRDAMETHVSILIDNSVESTSNNSGNKEHISSIGPGIHDCQGQ